MTMLLFVMVIMVLVFMVMIVVMVPRVVGIFNRNRHDDGDDPQEDQQQDHQNHLLGPVLVLQMLRLLHLRGPGRHVVGRVVDVVLHPVHDGTLVLHHGGHEHVRVEPMLMFQSLSWKTC